MNSTTNEPSSKPMTRRDLEARIIAKAWKDPDYKSRLIQNPKAVLRNELYEIDPSITLPDALNVQVHEETADLFHLVLPRNPTDIKLSEVIGDNLEGVATETVAVLVAVILTVAAVVVVTAVAGTGGGGGGGGGGHGPGGPHTD